MPGGLRQHTKAETPQSEQLKDASASGAEPFVWVRAFHGRDTRAGVQRGPANKSRVHERDPSGTSHLQWMKGEQRRRQSAVSPAGGRTWPVAGPGAPPSAWTSIRPPGQKRPKRRPPCPPQVRRSPGAGRADVKVQSPQPRGGADWANPLGRAQAAPHTAGGANPAGSPAWCTCLPRMG